MVPVQADIESGLKDQGHRSVHILMKTCIDLVQFFSGQVSENPKVQDEGMHRSGFADRPVNLSPVEIVLSSDCSRMPTLALLRTQAILGVC
jgi:hypothetical protein